MFCSSDQTFTQENCSNPCFGVSDRRTGVSGQKAQLRRRPHEARGMYSGNHHHVPERHSRSLLFPDGSFAPVARYDVWPGEDARHIQCAGRSLTSIAFQGAREFTSYGIRCVWVAGDKCANMFVFVIPHSCKFRTIQVMICGDPSPNHRAGVSAKVS